MRDYKLFDAELLRLIQNGCRTASALTAHLQTMARAVDRETDPYRVVDRRLQALRKKGHIRYANQQWRTTLS
jgi:hypothetical protein